MLIGTCFSNSAGSRIRRLFISLLLLSAAGSLPAQPESYFAGAYGSSGDSLKTTLELIIDGHTRLSYTPGVWNAHKDLYEDPDNSSNLILFYSQASIDKTLQDNGQSPGTHFNREHLWPRSYGVGSSGSDNTDLFHLVPAYKGVNSSRGNLYFDESNEADGSYSDPANALAPDCTRDRNSWEPADPQKGWVARAMFYMSTRYNYLVLVDSPPEPEPFRDAPYMAQLSVLLEWNRSHLPTDKERTVNQRIFDDYQGNRNPYIDFPEFADAVWVEGPSWGSWRLAHFSLVELLDPAISGDHADPDGDGLINLLELARYSDPRADEASSKLTATVTGDTIELSFVRAGNQESLGLDLLLEVSTDMDTWTAIDLSPADVAPLDADREVVRIARDIPEDSSEFYRLRVVRK